MPAKRHKLTFVNEPRSWLLDKSHCFKIRSQLNKYQKKKKKKNQQQP